MISIVCPMYNEKEVLGCFFAEISKVMALQSETYELICVDDGSSDSTLEILLEEKQKNTNIRIISFSRNFGKEAALTAGLIYAKGDAVIPVDADLQDPPELISLLIDKWKEGFRVVLAQRTDRTSDSFFKRLSAFAFYKFHNQLTFCPIPDNVGDFRLIDRKVVDSINDMPERQRFMKGIFSWVGFETTIISYTRPVRKQGVTKFNGWQLWNLALEGITSFSTIPLKIWSYLGALISLCSFIFATFIIVKTLIYGVEVPGYASLLAIVLFLGGTQLIGIGILGEYIGRIYMETKSRPLYIVNKEY